MPATQHPKDELGQSAAKGHPSPYVKIKSTGQTSLTPGSTVPLAEFRRQNQQALERGEKTATAEIWKGGKLEYLADSPEYLAYTIDDIGYRQKIDNAFQEAIARARRKG
jgi:hypothetical protein